LHNGTKRSAKFAVAACYGASSSSPIGRRGDRSPRSAKFTQRLVALLRGNNVLVAAGIPNANFGRDGDHIQLSPPLTIAEAEIDQLVVALDAALASVGAEQGASRQNGTS